MRPAHMRWPRAATYQDGLSVPSASVADHKWEPQGPNAGGKGWHGDKLGACRLGVLAVEWAGAWPSVFGPQRPRLLLRELDHATTGLILHEKSPDGHRRRRMAQRQSEVRLLVAAVEAHRKPAPPHHRQLHPCLCL